MRYNNKLTWLISAVVLLLLLFTAQPAAAENSFWDLDFGDKGNNFKVVDCDPGCEERNLERTVVQIIDGTFHRWEEYLVGDDGHFCIFLKEPEKRPLSAEEGLSLLLASRQWMDQDITPVAPDFIDPSDVFDMDDLMPVIEGGSPDWVSDIFIYQNYALTSGLVRVEQVDTEQYPWHTIGFVEVSFGISKFRASGALIAPQTVLTNAHNLYNSGMGGYFTDLKFYPGQHQEAEGSQIVRPYGYSVGIEGKVSPEYIMLEGSLNLTNAHDYGAIFLDSPFEEITTYMPLEFDYIPIHVNTAGYPLMADGDPTYAMWYDRGPVLEVKAREFTFEARSGRGASGSPVWVYDEDIENSRVVGLLAQALVNTDFRRGPRLTHHNQGLIEEWMRWAMEEEETSSEPEEPQEEPEEPEVEPEEPEVQYSLELNANPSAGGSLSGAGDYPENETVTVTAEAAAGYQFVSWTVNGTVISESEQYQFQLEENLTLTANFEPVAEEVEEEPEPEMPQYRLQGIVVEVGGDMVRVDLVAYATAYAFQNSELFQYLRDGNQNPLIIAVESEAGYILLQEYAKNYFKYGSVSMAIENSKTEKLNTMEAPF